MFYRQDNYVYKRYACGGSDIIELHGMQDIIGLTDGRLEWLTFDYAVNNYVPTPYSTPFELDINGTRAQIEPVNGVGTFALDAPLGEYTVKTVNENVGNAEIKVVVA